jgi:peptidyl-tRNA hydrolase
MSEDLALAKGKLFSACLDASEAIVEYVNLAEKRQDKSVLSIQSLTDLRNLKDSLNEMMKTLTEPAAVKTSSFGKGKPLRGD